MVEANCKECKQKVAKAIIVLPRPSLCGKPNGEDEWTDSKFKELCFHRLPNDDEQQGPAGPTPVGYHWGWYCWTLTLRLNLLQQIGLLGQNLPVPRSPADCMTRERLKVRIFITTKRPLLIDSSDDGGFDYVYTCLGFL